MNRLYERPQTKVIGNDMKSDADLGFKDEIRSVFESYSSNGIDLGGRDFEHILSSRTARQEFNSILMESMSADANLTSSKLSSAPFYYNYADKFNQLLENSENAMALEAVTQGYAPIVAYSPFFLKKQWVSCVFKDVLMTEVPTSPVINLAYEKRYIKTQAGAEYEIPNVFYDKEKMKELTNEATGLKVDESKKIALPLKNIDFLTTDYIPGLVVKDRSETLTGDIRVIKVEMDVSEAGDGSALKEIPCDIRTDVTTHNWINGKVRYLDPDNQKTVVSTIIGNVDFVAGTVTVFSDNDRIKSVWMGGTTANRFNERSLDVVRRVEQIQHVMPESGPRFNTPVTIEEAADALALQKIDMIADNVEYMGRSLAEFEDFEIRTFLWNSFDVQKAAGIGPHGYESLIVEGAFNLLPYDTYTHNMSDWARDSREYFERVLNELKQKLKTPDIVIVAVCNPQLVRFLQNGIEWVFTDDTQIAGIKIDYNFGVLTSSQDRVHIVTTHYMDPNDGIRFIVIPLTKELITYKHYKYNMVIDRGYRHSVHDLVPNVMATHRTLTFEVLPVQGRLEITGRDLVSPETLKR